MKQTKMNTFTIDYDKLMNNTNVITSNMLLNNLYNNNTDL